MFIVLNYNVKFKIEKTTATTVRVATLTDGWKKASGNAGWEEAETEFKLLIVLEAATHFCQNTQR